MRAPAGVLDFRFIFGIFGSRRRGAGRRRGGGRSRDARRARLGGIRGRSGPIDSRVVYEGRTFDVHLDRVRFPDGSEGELEIVRHPGAAAVLPIYRAGEWPGGTGPAVVLLRQYRYAAGGEIWEVPAGKLDRGESPQACARRELEEETGLRARQLRALTTMYSTPGFTDERIHLFAAVGLEPGKARPERSEFLERREVALEDALALVASGRIADGKTICALLYAATFAAELFGGRDPERGR